MEITMSTWIGIDVSKETLDFAWILDSVKAHQKVPNSEKGFMQMLEAAPADSCYVMEATGSYYINVALFLHEKGLHVAVVNPIRIRGHMKADMSRTKTDKADAHSIARFGEEKRPQAWYALKPEVAEMKQLIALDGEVCKQIGRLRNLKEATSCSVLASSDVLDGIGRMMRYMTMERQAIQAQLEAVAEKVGAREVEIMASIPGIGRSTALKMYAAIGDFRRFENSRKLVSFLGLSPLQRQSGTSIHSKGHISRMGGTRIRGNLYVCAWTAIKLNPQCREMWDRLRAKGMHGKKAIVAVMSKLIRQMYSMVVNDRLYDPAFR